MTTIRWSKSKLTTISPALDLVSSKLNGIWVPNAMTKARHTRLFLIFHPEVRSQTPSMSRFGRGAGPGDDDYLASLGCSDGKIYKDCRRARGPKVWHGCGTTDCSLNARHTRQLGTSRGTWIQMWLLLVGMPPKTEGGRGIVRVGTHGASIWDPPPSISMAGTAPPPKGRRIGILQIHHAASTGVI